ncbi:MAG: prolipoprotein diacylglyceryl transferase [Phycisphaerales bacterium]|nr:prolipoprotein diacylglyceryl transferase [Phycisphaerales bacterium]
MLNHSLQLASTNLGGWFHDLSPFFIKFTPTFGIRYYGLSYALGFLFAFITLKFLAKRNSTMIPEDRIGDAMMYLILGALIGGRLFYVIGYEPGLLIDFSSSAPWWGVFAINRGGMASHGGILGVAFACWRISRGFKDQTGKIVGRTTPINTLDTAALIAPFGLFFGRLANFINAELLGAVVANPGQHAPSWAVRYPQEIVTLTDSQLVQTQEQMDQVIQLSMLHMLPNEQDWTLGYARVLDLIQRGDDGLKAQLEPLIAARYPSQLFQASLDGLLVMFVVWIIAMKPRKPGVIAGCFGIVYALGRIPMDLIRLPDAGVTQFGPLTRGQTYSAITLLLGIALIVYAYKTKAPKCGGWKKSPNSVEINQD